MNFRDRIAIRTRPPVVRFTGTKYAFALLLTLTVLPGLPPLPATPALADTPNLENLGLDNAQFVRGLRERQMHGLLAYHLEQAPGDDPVEHQLSQVELYRMEVEDSDASPGARAEAVDNTLDAYRELIAAAEANDAYHHQLPIWRTEMAEFILRVALPMRHMNAGVFVEFGLPTRSARDTFDRLVLEAHDHAELAYLDAFELQGSLPRRSDFRTAYVNTGFWRTFNDEFVARRIPFTYGWASYYATLRSEPRGSLNEALDQLRQVDTDQLRRQAQVELEGLIGRVLVHAGRVDDGLEQLQRVEAAAEDGPLGQTLWIRLARVHALDQAEREAEAIELVQATLDSFRNAGQIPPPLLILVHDAWYRVSDDFAVYESLFDDPLVEGLEDQVESFVISRLASDPLSPQELAEERPRIVLAHVDAMLERAAELRNEGRHAASDEMYGNAITTINNLLDRSDLDSEREAGARFRLGAIAYRRDDSRGAINRWLELARKLPEEDQGRAAAVNAFRLAHNLYRRNQHVASMIEIFDEASEVLLTHQPDHPVAREHTYTRAAFLRQQERYDEAVDAYLDVPTDHPNYANALYETAVIYHTLWVSGDEDESPRRARQTLDAVDAVVQHAEDHAQNARIREMHGDALLMRAEVLLREQDEPRQAERVLDGFDDRFGEYDDLMRTFERLQVAVAVSLGEFEQARDHVRRFAERGTAEGGTMIRDALGAINRRAENLRDEGRDDGAQQLEALGIDLAEELAAWAQQQPNFQGDPVAQLPFELILARQYRVGGRLEESRDLLETLHDRELRTTDDGSVVTGADRVDVLYELARTARTQGDDARAQSVLTQVLRAHPSEEGDTWWGSWVMYLELRDQRYDELRAEGRDEEADRLSGDIFRSMARLRLQDDDLGGQRWARAFQRLDRRHRR